MRRLVYIGGENHFLSERFLSERPESNRVHLLTTAPNGEYARQLADRYANVEGVVVIPEAADQNLLCPEDLLILPISFQSAPMRFKPQVLMPDLTGYYALFRQLWGAGAREIDLYSLAGLQHLALPHLLDAFQNRHAGRRCFVAGNGPSLNAIDMTRLKGEIVLGSNQCYLGYEQWGFQFPYWGVYDQLQIQEYGPDYEEKVPSHGIQFFPFEYVPFLHFQNACPVNILWPRKSEREFSNDSQGVFRGHTVTYMLLQIAAIFGCNPIILIGVDHHFPLTRRYIASTTARRARRWITRQLRDTRIYEMANAAHQAWITTRLSKHREPQGAFWNTADAGGATHFDPNYTQHGARKFLPPEIDEMNRDYRCARQWADSHGVQILNASPGSALEVFPKVSYDELF